MGGERRKGVWSSPGGFAQVLRVTLPLQLMAASSAAYAFVDRMLLAKCSDLALEASVPGLVLGVLRYGSENGAMAFFDNLTFMTFVMVTGRLDAMSLAISNMAFGVNCGFFALVSGLRDGVSVLVGRFCGRRDFVAAERSLRSTLVISFAVAASFGVFVVLGAGWLADSFRSADSAFDRDAFRSLAYVVFSILAFLAFVFMRRWRSGRWRERAEVMESARTSVCMEP